MGLRWFLLHKVSVMIPLGKRGTVPGTVAGHGKFLYYSYIVTIASLQPTVCHYFIRLLKEKGLLLRCYTQVGRAVGILGGKGRLLCPGTTMPESSGHCCFVA